MGDLDLSRHAVARGGTYVRLGLLYVLSYDTYGTVLLRG
jgi:hypothetical protein